jgi:acylphosphatase
VASHQVLYSGRVQGVGFRYSVKQIAAGYEVVGWVRNLPDGRVELQVGGEHEEVEEFLAAIAGSPLRHHLRGIERHAVAMPLTQSGFVIEH